MDIFIAYSIDADDNIQWTAAKTKGTVVRIGKRFGMDNVIKIDSDQIKVHWFDLSIYTYNRRKSFFTPNQLFNRAPMSAAASVKRDRRDCNLVADAAIQRIIRG